ncbi:MAG: 2-oxoacid:acceptor oxidoreductase family protein, partial [bacterium]|nr:2-oxoacid:acceptor oxidoreductase family protein [bacterium]
MNKTYNIIIRGVGGQGLIILLSIIDEAAFIEGYDVKSSELHGLSQRGGSVETHIRFGEKVYSPLVSRGQVDLVIGLEILEGLRGFSQADSKTKFLINEYSLPFLKSLKKEEILEKLKVIPKNNLYLVPASEICKKEFDNEVVSGIYLLGYAIYEKLIPL